MSALEQTAMRPATYHFKLGDFDVATILGRGIVREGLSPAPGGEGCRAQASMGVWRALETAGQSR